MLMWAKRWSVVGFGVVALLAPTRTQLGLSGYHLSAQALEVALPMELTLTGSHAVEIRRAGREDMLRRAESFLPPVDTVLSALRALERRDPALLPDDNLWWVRTVYGVRIPYAVNALAISYYLELSRSLRSGSRALGSGVQMPTYSTLTYHATVAEQDHFFYGNHVFRAVLVARLDLSLRIGTGSTGMSFDLDRIVVLDRNGDPIAIFGDTVPEVWSYG